MQRLDANPQVISQVISDSIRVLSDRTNPLFPIEGFGLSFDDEDDIWTPWIDACELIASDDNNFIHWIHPDLRAQLNTLTTDMLRPYAYEHWPSTLTEVEKEDELHQLMERSREILSAYDLRCEATAPFVEAIKTLPVFTSATSALTGVLALIKDHSVDPVVGWKLLAIHAGLQVSGEHHFDRHVAKAVTLAALIDLPGHATPFAAFSPELRAAARLSLVHADETPDEGDMLMTAETIARGGLPRTPSSFVRFIHTSPVRLLEKIETGRLDPTPGSHVFSMATEIGRVSEGSMHSALRLIAAGNARLEKIGHTATLTPALCKLELQKEDEIPF